MAFETIKRHYLNISAPDGVSANWAWQKCRRAFLQIAGKKCVCCGYKKDIQVHHCYPRHLFPGLALDPANLIVLCRRCHFSLGHLCSYHNYNKNIFDVAFYANEHNEAGVT